MTAKTSQELKSLQSRRDKLEVKLNDSIEDKRSAQQAYDKTKHQLALINEQINRLTVSDIVVSEHAILRYLERVMGLDLEDIKKEILSDSMISQIKALGNGKYPVSKNVQAIVKNNTIVTIN